LSDELERVILLLDVHFGDRFVVEGEGDGIVLVGTAECTDILLVKILPRGSE
jgi:hypothetical protein